MATTSLPTTMDTSRLGNASRKAVSVSGLAMFTGKFSGKMCTWNSSAMDMLTILRRMRWGWVFLDQENSSIASMTSKPRSRMAWTMPLWERVKGSKVPGKKAMGRGAS